MNFDTEKHLEELINSIKKEKKLNVSENQTIKEGNSFERLGDFFDNKKEEAMVYSNALSNKDGHLVEEVYSQPSNKETVEFVDKEALYKNGIKDNYSFEIPESLAINKDGKKIFIPTFAKTFASIEFEKTEINNPFKHGEKLVFEFGGTIKDSNIIDVIPKELISEYGVVTKAKDEINIDGIFDNNIDGILESTIKKELFGVAAKNEKYERPKENIKSLIERYEEKREETEITGEILSKAIVLSNGLTNGMLNSLSYGTTQIPINWEGDSLYEDDKVGKLLAYSDMGRNVIDSTKYIKNGERVEKTYLLGTARDRLVDGLNNTNSLPISSISYDYYKNFVISDYLKDPVNYKPKIVKTGSEEEEEYKKISSYYSLRNDKLKSKIEENAFFNTSVANIGKQRDDSLDTKINKDKFFNDSIIKRDDKRNITVGENAGVETKITKSPYFLSAIEEYRKRKSSDIRIRGTSSISAYTEKIVSTISSSVSPAGLSFSLANLATISPASNLIYNSLKTVEHEFSHLYSNKILEGWLTEKLFPNKRPPNQSMIEWLSYGQGALMSLSNSVSPSMSDENIFSNIDNMVSLGAGLTASVLHTAEDLQRKPQTILNRMGRAKLTIEDNYFDALYKELVLVNGNISEKINRIYDYDHFGLLFSVDRDNDSHDYGIKFSKDFFHNKDSGATFSGLSDVKKSPTIFKVSESKVEEKKSFFDEIRDSDRIKSLGYIYVTPSFSDMLLNEDKFFKIPIQTSLNVSADRVEAEYNTINFLNRIGSVAQFVRTNSKTLEISTYYYVEEDTLDNSSYNMFTLQKIEYAYKSLLVPQEISKKENTNIEKITRYLSRPPIINILYGSETGLIETAIKDNKAFPVKDQKISAGEVINNFFTNIRWNKKENELETEGTMFYKSYVVTGLSIEKDYEETPLYINIKNTERQAEEDKIKKIKEEIDKGLDEEENKINGIKNIKDGDAYLRHSYPLDYAGFKVTMSLLEIDPNFLDINPTANDYYNFASTMVSQSSEQTG